MSETAFERVKRIYEQAASQCNRGDAWEWEMKFAELIVKECANAADEAVDARCVYPGDYVVESMGFGVDEGAAEWRSK